MKTERNIIYNLIGIMTQGKMFLLFRILHHAEKSCLEEGKNLSKTCERVARKFFGQALTSSKMEWLFSLTPVHAMFWQ